VPVSCGTIVGDLNNELGLRKERKEKGHQPPPIGSLAREEKTRLKCQFIFSEAFC
jgi:hypothetical protein